MAHSRSCVCDQERSRWAKTWFWITGAISVVALAHNQFLPLWNDYMNDEKSVVTKASIAVDYSISPPTPVICIPYYSRALENIENWIRSRHYGIQGREGVNESEYIPAEYEAMRNHSWDVWNLSATDLNRMLQEGRAKILDRVLQDEDGEYSSLKLNGTGYNWNQPIVDAVWQYVSDHIALDKKVLSDGRLPSNADRIHPMFSRQIDKLFQRVVGTMFISGYIPNYDYDIAYDLLGTRDVTIADNRLCFLWYKYGDATSTFNLRSPLSTTRNTIMVFQDQSLLYSPANRAVPLYETNHLDDSPISKESVTLVYSVQGRFEQEWKRESCGGQPPEKCSAERQALEAYNFCDCLPFAYRFLKDNPYGRSYCNASHYRSCNEKLMESAQRNGDYCKPECQFTFYSWMRDTKIETSNTTSTDGRTFIFRLQPLSASTFPMFTTTRQVINNPRFLLAQFGGLIGLFGFGMFMIIALVSFCIDAISRKHQNYFGSLNSARPNKGFEHVLADENLLKNDQRMIKIQEQIDQMKSELDEMTRKTQKEISSTE